MRDTTRLDTLVNGDHHVLFCMIKEAQEAISKNIPTLDFANNPKEVTVPHLQFYALALLAGVGMETIANHLDQKMKEQISAN